MLKLTHNMKKKTMAYVECVIRVLEMCNSSILQENYLTLPPYFILLKNYLCFYFSSENCDFYHYLYRYYSE